MSRRTPGNGPGPRGGGEALVAARVLVDETPAVAAEWRELCRWDPELAPDIVAPGWEQAFDHLGIERLGPLAEQRR